MPKPTYQPTWADLWAQVEPLLVALVAYGLSQLAAQIPPPNGPTPPTPPIEPQEPEEPTTEPTPPEPPVVAPGEALSTATPQEAARPRSRTRQP